MKRDKNFFQLTDSVTGKPIIDEDFILIQIDSDGNGGSKRTIRGLSQLTNTESKSLLEQGKRLNSILDSIENTKPEL